MHSTKLIEKWKAEEERPFIGWDFSYLDGRMLLEGPPWSYTSRARQLMRRASSVLDIGTGGGERLLAMRDSWPETVAVTEGYPPNVRLVSERLVPLGVRVVEADSDEVSPMPFEDGEFALALNRHAALHVDEIARILVAGGSLLTVKCMGCGRMICLPFFTRDRNGRMQRRKCICPGCKQQDSKSLTCAIGPASWRLPMWARSSIILRPFPGLFLASQLTPMLIT